MRSPSGVDRGTLLWMRAIDQPLQPPSESAAHTGQPGGIDPIAERVAEAQRKSAQHASRLRMAIPDLVRTLERHGAERVWLFGSLATNKAPTTRTDVDLCVLGLPEQHYFSSLADLLDLAPVNLVRWETASPSLRNRILADGIEITHDAS